MKVLRWIRIALVLALPVACSTATVTPPPPPPAVPPYAQAPHPGGYSVGDLRALFTDPSAPSSRKRKDCDAEFQKLFTSTSAIEERNEGVRELVRKDPVSYHWCFYGKLHDLQEALEHDPYIDSKQKATIDTYNFLTPVARAFMTEFHDSRYLRWAVQHYRHTSEMVFHRRLELSPQATSELVEVANPFGAWKRVSSEDGAVLQKYKIDAGPKEDSGVQGSNSSGPEAYSAKEDGGAPEKDRAPASGRGKIPHLRLRNDETVSWREA